MVKSIPRLTPITAPPPLPAKAVSTLCDSRPRRVLAPPSEWLNNWPDLVSALIQTTRSTTEARDQHCRTERLHTAAIDPHVRPAHAGSRANRDDFLGSAKLEFQIVDKAHDRAARLGPKKIGPQAHDAGPWDRLHRGLDRGPCLRRIAFETNGLDEVLSLLRVAANTVGRRGTSRKSRNRFRQVPGRRARAGNQKSRKTENESPAHEADYRFGHKPNTTPWPSP